MTTFVKPKQGKRVRNPDNNFAPLPSAGDFVQPSTYWHRRLAEGGIWMGSDPEDVAAQEAKAARAAKATTKTPAKASATKRDVKTEVTADKTE